MQAKKRPIVSIITACLNSEKLIEKTMRSVLAQTYPNIEYIIVDGGSIDETLSIIKQNKPFFKSIRWLSEPDKGIYNAFNKGLSMSTGDIIYFLNSGDYLIERDIVGNIVTLFEDYDLDILYGDTKLGKIDYRKNNVENKFKLIFRTICHQAVFAKKGCFANNIFNEDYKWLSDYEWIIKCFDNVTLKKLYYPVYICNFDPKNNTGLDDFSLLKERYRERMLIGKNSFSGLYKIIFITNQIRLNLKLHLIGA